MNLTLATYDISLLVLAPLVLLPNAVLLLRGEVVLDVEVLPDLLRSLPPDHVAHRLAGDIQEALDIQVVGGQDQLKEDALVHIEEVLVPVRDVTSPPLGALILLGWWRIIIVLGGPLDDLLKDGSIHVGQRHFIIGTLLLNAEVFQHGLDRDRLLGDLHVHLEGLPVA